MQDDRRLGVFLHSIFPIPGWGGRDMGFAGWKGFINWARALGYNSCIYFAFPQHRLEDPSGRWRSAAASTTAFSPPGHPSAAGTSTTRKTRCWPRRRPAFTKKSAPPGRPLRRFRRHAPRIGIMMTLGGPTFSMEHPEYQAICPGDFCRRPSPFAPCTAKWWTTLWTSGARW